MSADAVERGGAERYQHEIARVRGDARNDAQQHDDVRQRRFGGDGDELAYQRPDQPGHLGEADADHHDQDDPHRGEAHEVPDERR
ncbi:MAG: hypothetical protein V9E83_10470 [Baekduia sp.]